MKLKIGALPFVIVHELRVQRSPDKLTADPMNASQFHAIDRIEFAKSHRLLDLGPDIGRAPDDKRSHQSFLRPRASRSSALVALISATVLLPASFSLSCSSKAPF